MGFHEGKIIKQGFLGDTSRQTTNQLINNTLNTFTSNNSRI